MNKIWFRIGILAIFIFSLSLRFWGLERFNTLVFDEIYFATFGNNYLTRTPFFNAHPPLSQYIIGIGIWLSRYFPFWHQPVNGLAGSLLSPGNYRWINALTGSFIPVIITTIAYQISYRRGFALLAGFFTACDGLFLVESRYALNNIYIVIFGLLGQWFLLLALANNQQRRKFLLVLAGIFFGASAGTKWNGLWFLLGAYFLWIAAWIIRWLQSANLNYPINKTRVSLFPGYLRPLMSGERVTINKELIFTSIQTPLQNLTQINIFQMFSYLGIIPAIIYSIIWIPHLQLDKKYGFIAVHQQILQFHLHMGGNSPDVHPYCAAWYKWPLLTRPMAYYYETTQSFTDPLPVFGPPLPSGTGKVIYDVHAMGNPFLWWFGIAATIFLMGILILQILVPTVQQKRFSLPANLSIDTWIALYLVLNYAANLLPWVKVNRCVFIYHYMPAVVFTFLAIAWFVDQYLRSYYWQFRFVGLMITVMIVAAFIFWMPIYLGLPIPAYAYKWWFWFESWI
jgi:dolichyl-phosphate-mannose--protein O-mannosyl transferase